MKLITENLMKNLVTRRKRLESRDDTISKAPFGKSELSEIRTKDRAG